MWQGPERRFTRHQRNRIGAWAAVCLTVAGAGCHVHSRPDEPDANAPVAAPASVGAPAAVQTVVADRPAAKERPSEGLNARMVGNRTDTPPAPSKAGPLARSASVVEADDFTVAEVGQNFVKFSEIYEVIRDDLRRLKSEVTPERWEQAAMARFHQELNREIQHWLVFDETWRSLSPEQEDRLKGIAEARIKAAKTSFGSESVYRRYVLAKDLSPERIKLMCLRTEVLGFYRDRLSKRVYIRPDELRAGYERFKDEFYVRAGGVRFRVLEISAKGLKKKIDDKPLAEPVEVRDAISAKLKAGADFVELTKKYSDYFAEVGGLWGAGNYVLEADLSDKLLRDALVKMKPGDVTVDPIAAPDGSRWVFLKLEDRREKIYRPLDEEKVPEDMLSEARDNRRPEPLRVSEDLRRRLRDEKLQEMIVEEYDRVRSRAFIGQYDDGLILSALRRKAAELK